MTDIKKNNPTVFISYAHEGDLGDRVKALAGWLTERGVEVITDHPYENRPPEIGWRPWMQQNIEDADMVLIVCSERYKNLFEGREVPDSGGLGVTWESAIITSDLYHSKMRNSRFYPILPDGGAHGHVPAVLTNWHNNHRFPSGNDCILKLICEEVVVPKPKRPITRLLLGELTGSGDPRLQPREGELIGRTGEVAEVLAFLTGQTGSAAVCGHVRGSGGIGKTEVCKGALKAWLAENPAERVFWIEVSDDADARRLLAHIGKALDLESDTILRINDVEALRPYLRDGLYYLDNLESVAESEGGIETLRALAQIPGVRVLASSRVPLDGVLGASIPVERLDAESSVRLFQRCWTGSGNPDENELRCFVDKELGGHALGITLLARLGRAYGWEKLQKHWHEEGTALAKARKSTGRLDSLDISFALTARRLSGEAGALDLWQFAALYPSGFDEESLDRWESVSGNMGARRALIDYHVLTLVDGNLSMLPPIARYAMDNNSSGIFNWESARRKAYDYFISLSEHASDTASSDENIEARTRCGAQLWAIAQLFAADARSGSPSLDHIRRLHLRLTNVYTFNALPGLAALRRTKRLLGDGLSEHLLGDLESLLGNVDQARAHYDEAVQLYKKEQAKLGLANVYQSMGDLLMTQGKLDEALDFYTDALALYRNERDPMGEAYTLSEIIRCLYRKGSLGGDDMKKLATASLVAAQGSGVESVFQYVMATLYEAHGEDEAKLGEFLKSLGLRS